MTFIRILTNYSIWFTSTVRVFSVSFSSRPKKDVMQEVPNKYRLKTTHTHTRARLFEEKTPGIHDLLRHQTRMHSLFRRQPPLNSCGMRQDYQPFYLGRWKKVL